MDACRINVGGTIFETTRTTLNSVSDWKLADEQVLHSSYRNAEDDFFFDRDPVVFGAILNYLRTSQLHLPTTLCGPSIKAELEFWNINDHEVQRCCWANYNKWNSSKAALSRLERDRKAYAVEPIYSDSEPCWPRHRATVWQFLNRSNSSKGAKVFSIVSFLFVLASITTLILSTTNYFADSPADVTINISTVANETVTCTTETTDNSHDAKKYYDHIALDIINIVCLVYFVCEYVVRFVYSPHKRRFLISFLSIIDVLAIVPDVIEYVVFPFIPSTEDRLSTETYATILRALRILRIFRLVRHSAGLWVLIYTLKASMSELLLLVWLLAIGTVFFASLIYIAEEKEDFQSIPDGFWWAIITMTTVGYGDMSPKTPWGKVIGSLCAMSGVLVLGFSVPALVNNFIMYYTQLQFANMMEQREKIEKAKWKENANSNNNADDSFDISTEL